MEEGSRLGTGGKPPRTGIFIRDHLRDRGESYAGEIHRTYKEAHRGWTTTRGNRYRLSTYNSFAIYIAKLVIAGLLERTGRKEESDHPKSGALDYPERVYLRLSDKGRRASDYVWGRPLRIWYKPLDWERVEYSSYIQR